MHPVFLSNARLPVGDELHGAVDIGRAGDDGGHGVAVRRLDGSVEPGLAEVGHAVGVGGDGVKDGDHERIERAAVDVGQVGRGDGACAPKSLGALAGGQEVQPEFDGLELGRVIFHAGHICRSGSFNQMKTKKPLPAQGLPQFFT